MPHVRFGYCVPIFAAPGYVSSGMRLFRTPLYPALDIGATMTLARQAEPLGYDSLWVADHLMRGKDEAILEGWTVLAALAGATSTIRLGLIHQTHFFRHPSLVAKMVATLDQISGGRFTYFLDCGNQRDEYVAYGLPWSDDDETRVAHMVEGLELTLALWVSRAPVNFDGAYYHLHDAVCNPPPVQQPHPPIWFGGVRPPMLRACARFGQGWNTTPVSVEQLRDHLSALTAACDAAGRSVDELEKSLEIQIMIAPDSAAVRQRFQEIEAATPSGQALDPSLRAYLDGMTDTLPEELRRTVIAGAPDDVRRQIQEYIAAGITHFMLWFLDAPSDAGMRLFAEQVLPEFHAPRLRG